MRRVRFLTLVPVFALAVFARAQGTQDVVVDLAALGSPERVVRRAAEDRLIVALAPEHRAAFLAVLDRAEELPAAALDGLAHIVERRVDLLAWLLDASFDGKPERAAVARVLLGDHVVAHVRARRSAREPLPLARVLGITPWTVDSLDLRDLLRDLRHLALPAVPLVLDPEVDERLPVEFAFERQGVFPAPIAWILGTAARQDLVVQRVDGCVLLQHRHVPPERDLPARVADWLARCARAEGDAAFAAEALTALQVPGWHAAVEARIARGDARSTELARGLVRGGAPHAAAPPGADAVDALLDLAPWSPVGERHVVRYLVQRLAPVVDRERLLARVEARLTTASGSAFDRALRVAAWFRPDRHADRLQEWLRTGHVDRAAFAWRVTERAGLPLDPNLLDARARADGADPRIRRAWLERFGGGAPWDAAALRERHARVGVVAGQTLDPWRAVLDVRAADPDVVRAVLEALLDAGDEELSAVAAESFLALSRAAPAAREGLRAVFQRWAAETRPDAGRHARVRALAERFGFRVSPFGVAEVRGGGNVRPRLLDADPFEGGIWEGS